MSPSLRMNRKGIAEKELLYLLIGIAIFLVLVFFGMKIYEYMTSKGDVEGCRLSVLAASQTRLAGQTPIDLDCPRKTILFSEDKYTVDGKNKDYSTDDYTTNIKNVFAREMAECWYKTGQGYVNVFEENVVSNQNACLVCAQIHFEDQPSGDIGTVLDYIKETKMSANVEQMGDTTYYNYINRDWKQKAFNEQSVVVSILQSLGISYETKEIHTNILLDNGGTINPTKDYYILLLSVKKGAFEFYEEDTYFIVSGRMETLTDPKTKFCNYIYN